MTGFLGDPLAEHVAAVEQLAEYGVTPPGEWTALRDRWREQATSSGAALAAYTAGVIAGAKNLDELRALALAEQAASPQVQASVNNAVRMRVLGKLTALYADVAAENYRKLAAAFNTSAEAFHDAADTTDPERPAEELVTASTADRQAWTDAALAARELDALLAPLQAAARLAGADASTPEALIALTANVDGLHRRRVWEAWSANGRTGRWGALAALGAELHAADDPRVEPYRRPAPVEERWVSVGRGQSQRVIVDPEDNPELTLA